MKIRNSYMPTKITKCTEKGQITLPKKWRELFDTDSFIVDFDNKQLIVRPIEMAKLNEEIVFDADRDNQGKGIPIDEMIKLLKKSRNG
jgi:AbrB family looped-hinge helix DNA binding protein